MVILVVIPLVSAGPGQGEIVFGDSGAAASQMGPTGGQINNVTSVYFLKGTEIEIPTIVAVVLETIQIWIEEIQIFNLRDLV